MLNRKTDTTIFLLPILGINPLDLEVCGFQDSYIHINDGEKEYKDSLYLTFKPLDEDIFISFTLEEEKRCDVYNIYKKDDLWIMVYKFPEQYLKDKEKVINGSYSETSDEYKNNFRKFKKLHGDTIPSLQHLVFSKDPILRNQWIEIMANDLPEDSEVWGKFNIKDNTLKL